MIRLILKSNFMLKLAAVLLCLVLISSHFTFGLFAKYTSSAAAEDSARVALFRVETELDRISLSIDEGEEPELTLGGEFETQSVQIPFSIMSSSEVQVGYSVKVDFGVALPQYISLTLSDGTTTQTLYANGTESAFTFSDFGTLASGAAAEQKAELTLTISVTDFEEITTELSIPTATLTVRVYQVD